MNRRDFLTGMLTGVAASGVATAIRVNTESDPCGPDYGSLNHTFEILYGEKDATPEQVIEIIQWASDHDHGPIALFAVHNMIHNQVVPKDGPFKAQVINSRAFMRLMERHGHLLM